MVVLVAMLQVMQPAAAPPRAERPPPTWDACWRMDIACAKEPDHFTGRWCQKARRCFDRAEAR